jgi:hypothetical protein
VNDGYAVKLLASVTPHLLYSNPLLVERATGMESGSVNTREGHSLRNAFARIKAKFRHGSTKANTPVAKDRSRGGTASLGEATTHHAGVNLATQGIAPVTGNTARSNQLEGSAPISDGEAELALRQPGNIGTE